MLRKIVVPLDGSSLADGILTQLHRILKTSDVEVVLVRVLAPALIGERRGGADPLDVARAELDARATLLRVEGVSADFRILVGDAAERIVAFAAEHGASLIALASHGRSGIGRFVRGSVAERILRAARTPVLVVNPWAIGRALDHREVRMKKILVPLDLSEASTAVFPLVRDLARLYGSEIVLFHAVEPIVTGAATEQLVASAWSEAETWLEARRTALEGQFSRVRVAAGPAAAAILDAADDEKADLIAMTTHGRSGPSRWILGSVAETVLRHCVCPMLVQRTAGFETTPLGGGA